MEAEPDDQYPRKGGASYMKIIIELDSLILIAFALILVTLALAANL